MIHFSDQSSTGFRFQPPAHSPLLLCVSFSCCRWSPPWHATAHQFLVCASAGSLGVYYQLEVGQAGFDLVAWVQGAVSVCSAFCQRSTDHQAMDSLHASLPSFEGQWRSPSEELGTGKQRKGGGGGREGCWFWPATRVRHSTARADRSRVARMSACQFTTTAWAACRTPKSMHRGIGHRSSTVDSTEAPDGVQGRLHGWTRV